MYCGIDVCERYDKNDCMTLMTMVMMLIARLKVMIAVMFMVMMPLRSMVRDVLLIIEFDLLR